MSRGFVLVEVSISYVILSLALAALAPVFILCVRAAESAHRVAVSAQLAAEMIEEVRLRKWDESTPSPPARVGAPGPIGVEAGEDPADKRTFDDVDDFDGWTEAGVLDPVMRPVPAFAAYSRRVSVRYVDAGLSPSAGPTDYKLATACAWTGGMKPVCLDALFTNR